MLIKNNRTRTSTHLFALEVCLWAVSPGHPSFLSSRTVRRPSDLGLGLELHHQLSWDSSLQRDFSASKIDHVVDRVLVLQLGVRREPLRWESQDQDIRPPETSQPHIISIGESSPRDLCLNAKTQLCSTTNKLQCLTPHAKQ